MEMLMNTRTSYLSPCAKEIYQGSYIILIVFPPSFHIFVYLQKLPLLGG